MLKTLKMIVGLALLLTAMIFLTGGKGQELTAADRTHVVTAGQTVWGIATKYMEYQDKTRDVRELVYDIRQRNGLHNVTIQPGDVLVIPLMVNTANGKR